VIKTYFVPPRQFRKARSSWPMCQFASLVLLVCAKCILTYALMGPAGDDKHLVFTQHSPLTHIGISQIKIFIVRAPSADGVAYLRACVANRTGLRATIKISLSATALVHHARILRGPEIIYTAQ
jgi:hypothetical protein